MHATGAKTAREYAMASNTTQLQRWSDHRPHVPHLLVAFASVSSCVAAAWGGLIPTAVLAAGFLILVIGRLSGRALYDWVKVVAAHHLRRFVTTPDTLTMPALAATVAEVVEGVAADEDSIDAADEASVAPKRLPGQPGTAVNDRTGGGVRYLDDTTIVVIQLLGRPHAPTYMTGAAHTATTNVIRTQDVYALMKDSDLVIGPVSIISHGARVRRDGDYARIYTTLIGAPPYYGERETWLILRVSTGANIDNVTLRHSPGRAVVAAAQKIVMSLRTKGIRAKVGTETDVMLLENKLGGSLALQQENRRWRAVRSASGWLSTYYYRPEHMNDQDLARVWSRREDSITQNVTLYPDGRTTATVTIQTPQIEPIPPTVVLSALPGEQATAVASNQPRPAELVGGPAAVAAGPADLAIPIASSGPLIGVLPGGNRLMVPLTDPDGITRVHIDATDPVLKRLIMRAAAAGERVTVHTSDPARWRAMVMPGIRVSSSSRPAAGTTISVVDAGVSPTPQPATTITLGPVHNAAADITIIESGPAEVDIYVGPEFAAVDKAKGEPAEPSGAHAAPEPVRNDPTWHSVEVELFEVENSYADASPAYSVDEESTGPINTIALQQLSEGT